MEKAAEFYRKAADKGLNLAPFLLGMCYYKGNGVPEDKEKAAFYVKESAKGGFSNAQYALGLFYKAGVGVPKDM